MAGPAIGLILLIALTGFLSVPLRLLFLLLGLRGKRLGTAPTCARCNFDLAGISTASGSKCPECGTVLDGKVATGRRTRRVPLVVLGTLLLVLSVGSVAAIVATATFRAGPQVRAVNAPAK